MKTIKTIHFKKAQNFNENKVIFVDLDGTLIDWDGKVADMFHLNLNDKTIRQKVVKRGDIVKILGMKEDDFWRIIDKEGPEWWENLELLPWAKDLYNLLKKKYQSVCFLTSPSNNPSSAYGKIKWIKKHFDTKDFLIGKNKHFCAHKNAYLIDDSSKKINKFIEHGGHGFLWPHSLLLKDGKKDIKQVFSELIEYIEK